MTKYANRLLICLMLCALLLPAVQAETGTLTLTGIFPHMQVPENVLLDEMTRYNATLTALGEDINTLDTEDPDLLSGKEWRLNDERMADFAQHLVLSPDASRLFMISGGQAFTYDFGTQHFRIVTPDPAMGQQYYADTFLPQFGQLEDLGVQWSPDGRYMVFTAPRLFLIMMRSTSALLLDVEQGIIKPLVDEPPFELMQSDAGEGGRSPLKAGFSQDGSQLFVEFMGKRADEAIYSEITAFDLEMGAESPVAQTDWEAVTTDARLWQTDCGLVYTYANLRRKGPVGVALTDTDGTTQVAEGDQTAAPSQQLPSPQLIDVAASRGLLFSQWAVPTAPMLQLFTCDTLSDDALNKGLVIKPQAAPNERLVSLPLADVMQAQQDAFTPGAGENTLVPMNGALSPDGQYMALLAYSETTARLFVYAFEDGTLNEVTLSGEEMNRDSLWGLLGQRVPQNARGMRWAGKIYWWSTQTATPAYTN